MEICLKKSFFKDKTSKNVLLFFKHLQKYTNNINSLIINNKEVKLIHLDIWSGLADVHGAHQHREKYLQRRN